MNIAKKSNVPVINAGDGLREHPTQALLDALTIKNRKGIVRTWNFLKVNLIS